MSRSLAIVVATGLLSLGCSSSPTGEAVVVGHVMPRDLPPHGVGAQTLRGVALAVADVLSPEKRLPGRTLEIHHVSPRPGETTVADETVRLAVVSRAAALLGSLDFADTASMVRASQPYGIPLLTSSALSSPVPENAFSTNVTPEERGLRLGRFAREERKGGRLVALIDTRDSVAKETASAFVRAFSPAEKEVEWLPFDNDPALTAQWSRVGRDLPDAILFAGSSTQLTQRPQFPKAIPLFFSGDLLGGPESATTDGSPIYRVTPFVFAESSEGPPVLARRFQEIHGNSPSPEAMAAAELANLLVEAVRYAQSVRSDRLRGAFAGLEIPDGPFGGGMIDRETHHARRATAIVVGTGNQLRIVKRFDAGRP